MRTVRPSDLTPPSPTGPTRSISGGAVRLASPLPAPQTTTPPVRALLASTKPRALFAQQQQQQQQRQQQRQPKAAARAAASASAMTSNAFAALQGLNDAQLPRVIAGKAKSSKAATTAAAAAAAAGGGGGGGGGGGAGASSSAAASSKKPPPAPAPPAAGPPQEDDDDGFTPVVTKGGKRAAGNAAPAAAAKDASAASSSAAAAAPAKQPPAAAAGAAAAAAAKKISKESRSASKTWADEIEEQEEEGGAAAAHDDAGPRGEAAAAAAGKGAAAANGSDFLRDPLVWVDLEMTGLDVRNDTIIEIAVMVSDGQLRRVVEGPEIAIHHPDSVLDAMNAWSKEQHARSGLTARCRASAVSLAEAEERVLEFVKRHCEYQAGIFAGNSVHVDRAFLADKMPRLCEHLHYRIVDVSSVAELARRWHPKAWRDAPKKKKAHTAMADVRESLAELRYYRERLFNKRA